jgi:PIN domain nuclease of toxin-antitoxin system
VRLLLDTHALIWSVDEPAKLGPDAAQAISDPANELLLSAASIWELSIKVSLGKLNLSLPFRTWMDQAIADLGVNLLPITVEYADAAAQLPNHHGDPFDRMLIGQTQVENIPIASGDAALDKYGVTRLW